jgi:hypothetical protein
MAVKLIAGAAGVAAFTVSYCVLSKLDNAITNKIVNNKNKKAIAEAQRQQALLYQQQAIQMAAEQQAQQQQAIQMAAEQQAQQQQAMEMANRLYEQAAAVMAQRQQQVQQPAQQPASVINWDNPSETELEFAASMGDPRALKILSDRMDAYAQQQAQQQAQQPVVEIIPPAEDVGNTGLQLKPGQKVVLASDAKTIEGETLTRFKGIFRGYENDGKVAVVTVSYGGNIGSKNHKVPADVVTPA